MRKVLAIDLETYSDVDLAKCGVYAYVESPCFEILLMAYSFDDEDTKIIDLACGEKIPPHVSSAVFNDNITKTAFNAAFERICLSRHFGKYLSPESWSCTAVMAAMMALPMSLDKVGQVLGLKEKKMKEGRDLIRYFCLPCISNKNNNNRCRNLPDDDMEKWNLFKRYCIRDVDVEKSIRKKIVRLNIGEKELCSGSERELYILDQKINDRGISVDIDLVKKAVDIENRHKEIITQKAYEITGLENPNSVNALKIWFHKRGLNIDSMSKAVIESYIKNNHSLVKPVTENYVKNNPSLSKEKTVQFIKGQEEVQYEVIEMLKLRLLMAKTSVKKYEAIKRSVCSDGRVHGLFQFYGANRSGRWAGRLVQVQNLPQNHLKDLDTARELVKYGTFAEMEMFYDNTAKVLSELIRTAFVPRKGCRFIVADFSAIEARVLAYLADERWRLQVFKTHGKIYEASASAMFHVPIEKVTKGSVLRQKGKISELALGYGGAAGALTAMGALDMGLDESELNMLVLSWRNSNPKITRFWWQTGKAAMEAVMHKTETKAGKIKFTCCNDILFITLPSGRKLSYIKPRISLNKFNKQGLSYEGIGENKKWTRIDTYGPKLVENIVQAVARDILAEAMLRLDNAGFHIVMHVHDEVVLEVPYDVSSAEEVCRIMTKVPLWVEGLPLNAEGYECAYYKKD